MSQANQQIEQIELSIEQAQKMVEFRDRILRLSSNRDFKAVILEGYCRDEVLRLTSVLGVYNPTMVAARSEIVIELQAIAKLQEFLNGAVRMGDTAAREIKDHEDALDELREEAELEGAV